MEHSPDAVAGVTVGVALAAGMVAQALARHIRLPGIVVLLGTGVLLGPDLLGVVRPGELGEALHVLVGFAVAVILFEGGLNMDLRRLRQEAAVIRRLITIGALITGAGGTVAAHYLLGWSWQLSAAFGSLVIVTGPTVVTPLLRRIKVKHTVSTVLEAEGVLIDPIGAVIAVVTLQVIIGSSITEGLVAVGTRLGFGLAAGLIGGALLAVMLRFERVVPEGLENVFTLSLVLALFQISNWFLPESGVMTVTAAGMVVGNVPTKVQRDLAEFKEQLTVMLIGMLFILLAADVRLTDVSALGVGGAATVAALMLLVRPVNIAVCTIGTGMTLRERAFLSWIAPRGVVAAAVATLFSQAFDAAGIPGGKPLQALVFMVIAGTVVIQGLTGGAVASLLGLRRPDHEGWAILGANEVGLALGRLLRMSGEEVIFIDSNPAACSDAEEAGFAVVYGNVIRDRTLQRARLEDRAACIAVTPNEEVNLLFASAALSRFSVPRVSVGLDLDHAGVNPEIARSRGASVLFGVPRDINMWSVRMRRGGAGLESWRLDEKPWSSGDADEPGPFDFPRSLILPLVVQRGNTAHEVFDDREFRKGDVLHLALDLAQRDQAHDWLVDRGWALVEELDLESPVAGVRDENGETS